MDFTLADAYAPICACDRCGADCNLEAAAWDGPLPKDLEVRCILCGKTTAFTMAFVEEFYRTRYDVKTWLCEDTSGQHPDGCLVLGDSLFATSEEKRRLQAECDEEGPDGEAGQRLVQIRDREELVIHYAFQNEFDTAYHYAAAPHDCGFKYGQGEFPCREMVNGIVMGLEGFAFEFFSVYGVVMAAWNQLLDEIRQELHETEQRKVKLTNETEVRTRLVALLNANNRYGYEIIWTQDRPVYIKVGNKHRMRKPDVGFEQLIAIELKSFLRFQKYGAAGARKELQKDVVKLPTYDGAFDIAFMLCVSDHLTAKELYPGTPPGFPIPIRWSIVSLAE